MLLAMRGDYLAWSVAPPGNFTGPRFALADCQTKGPSFAKDRELWALVTFWLGITNPSYRKTWHADSRSAVLRAERRHRRRGLSGDAGAAPAARLQPATVL